MAKTATLVRKLDGFRGDARLYILSETVGYDQDWDTKEYAKESDHVIVSAIHVLSIGPETYIFPADENGIVLDWGELDGSFRGSPDHEEALRSAGYEVAIEST